jgi:glycosyltransferase involved in cell wall biosynthesis
MYRKKSISLVIPAYNEEKLIKPTLQGVPRIVDNVYVVNDGSTDRTASIVKAFGKKDRRIRLINHERNCGVGMAIINGYLRSSKDGNDLAVTIGGDNQMDLSEIKKFLDPIIDGKADYTKGNRFMHNGNAFSDMPRQRFIGNSLLSLITKAASGYWKIFDSHDGYTAISKNAIDTIDWDRAWKGYGYPGDFLVKLNVHNQKVSDVSRKAIYLKGERQTQIKTFRYLLRVSPMMFRNFLWRLKTKYLFNDFHPLVLFYIIGMILLPIGGLLGLKVLYDALTGPVSGNQAILVALFLITGFQSLIFGMFFDMEHNQHLQNQHV